MTHTRELPPTTTRPERTGTPVPSGPSRATVLRLCGLALALAGPLCIAGGTIHPIVDGKGHSVEALTGSGTPLAQSLLGIGTALLILGLPGFYAWVRPRLGTAGFIGLLCYLIGNITTAAGHLAIEIFVAHPLAADPATAHLISDNDNMVDSTAFLVFNQGGGLVMLAGMGMLGASLLRNDAVPRWISVLTLVGMVAFFLPMPAVQHLTGFIWEAPRGIAVAALGILMLRNPNGLRRWASARQDDAAPAA